MSNFTLKAGRNLSVLLLPGLFLCVAACSSQQNINFSVIKESKQCRTQQPSIEALESQEDKDTLIRNLSTFTDKGQSINPLLLLLDDHSTKEQLFVISQGQKPSAGYGFLVSKNTGSLVDSTLTLPISFTKPQANTMQAQVMTSPCVVIGIDKNVRFDRLLVDNLSYTP